MGSKAYEKHDFYFLHVAGLRSVIEMGSKAYDKHDFLSFCMNPDSGVSSKWVRKLMKNTIFINFCMNPASGVSSKWVRKLMKNTIFINFS